MAVLIASLAVLTFLIALFGFLFWRLASRFDDQADLAKWLEEFSSETYAPMERLLDRSDFAFLESQTGYRPEIGARLLKERKRLFLGYLSFLVRDFNQLLRIARVIMVASTEDRADFAKELWRQQIAFYGSVCAVRIRVALYPVAWSGMDASRLVRALQSMRDQVQQLTLQPVRVAGIA